MGCGLRALGGATTTASVFFADAYVSRSLVPRRPVSAFPDLNRMSSTPASSQRLMISAVCGRSATARVIITCLGAHRRVAETVIRSNSRGVVLTLYNNLNGAYVPWFPVLTAVEVTSAVVVKRPYPGETVERTPRAASAGRAAGTGRLCGEWDQHEVARTTFGVRRRRLVERAGRCGGAARVSRRTSAPSRITTAAMTGVTSGSAHDQPSVLSSTSPASSTAHRYVHRKVCFESGGEQ